MRDQLKFLKELNYIEKTVLVGFMLVVPCGMVIGPILTKVYTKFTNKRVDKT